MNIFFLHRIARLCAKYHCNKHVVKMIIETCQMLSTCWWICDVDFAQLAKENMYKPTHANHPCTVWARTHQNNYIWLASLGLELCAEYEARFGGKEHAAKSKLLFLATHVPPMLIDQSLPLIYDAQITMPPQCMPPELRIDNEPELAYRAYYKTKPQLWWWRPIDADMSLDGWAFAPDWLQQDSGILLRLAEPKYYLQKRAAHERSVDKEKNPRSKRKRVDQSTANNGAIEIAI